MNFAAIQTAIYAWASARATATQAGTTVYWDNPNAPRPPNPSVRLKLIGGPFQVGLDELRDGGNSTDFLIVGPRTITLSVNAYGDQARQLISDLLTSLSDPLTQATLDTGGVSSLKASAVRDLSQLLDTKFEQRFQIDIDLLAMESTVVQPGDVQHMTGTGTLTGSQGETITIQAST